MTRQPLNDGIVSIYAVEDVSSPGGMPEQGLTIKGKLRFHRRTVGVQRQYLAAQAHAKVDYLLRCPYVPAITVLDVAIPTIDSKQYRITAIQVPEDIRPPVMDLTLERLEADYDLP